jgi:hypothetical protein
MIKTLPVMASSWTDVGKDSSNCKFETFSEALDEKETRPIIKVNVRK